MFQSIQDSYYFSAHTLCKGKVFFLNKENDTESLNVPTWISSKNDALFLFKFNSIEFRFFMYG